MRKQQAHLKLQSTPRIPRSSHSPSYGRRAPAPAAVTALALQVDLPPPLLASTPPPAPHPTPTPPTHTLQPPNSQPCQQLHSRPPHRRSAAASPRSRTRSSSSHLVCLPHVPSGSLVFSSSAVARVVARGQSLQRCSRCMHAATFPFHPASVRRSSRVKTFFSCFCPCPPPTSAHDQRPRCAQCKVTPLPPHDFFGRITCTIEGHHILLELVSAKSRFHSRLLLQVRRHARVL